ncbi:MAG TPA: cation:proton antiporter [Kofleriaceae bacterium]|nr:cation:proton antiporter [Kofleriaceae bacterium]
MKDAHTFIEAIAVVLCTAGVTTVLFHRLRQPVVLGYILAGFIVGPNVPVPLVADRDAVHTMSELGVILLMFALGLEFSLRKLIKVGPSAGLTAVIQSSFMVWLGYLVGQAFGWTTMESLFAGAVIAISSTTIIAKAFDEQGIRGPLRELVVGILIVEDLIGILLMAILTALAAGGGLSSATLLRSSGELAAFLIGLLVVGLLVVPRVVRAVERIQRPEMTVVVSIGICFASALLAHSFGYSVALGAFLAGSLVAESGVEHEVERLILPIRDMFAAVFFVSVGMLIDPALIEEHWIAIAVIAAVVVAGKLTGVALGAFLAGNGTRTSVRAGMSLAQIGEFSFIIAALGTSLGVVGDFLYPVAAAVSAITTLTTPWLIRVSDRTASLIDRKLPRPVQTFTSLYGSWLEQIKAASRRATTRARTRSLVRLLLLDAVLLAAVVIGGAVAFDRAAPAVADRLGLSIGVAQMLLVAGTILLASPFGIGVFRITRGLGVHLADSALPRAEDGALDLAAAPRRALVVTIQLAVALVVLLPLFALTQPFLPGYASALVLVALLLVFGVAFWRTTANLHGHVRAGAEVVVEALAASTRESRPPTRRPLSEVEELLPGLGKPVSITLGSGSAGIGKSLAELNLRGQTGAMVIAITRSDQSVMIPQAGEVLRPGDVLAITGTEGAIAAAEALLRGGQQEGAG